METTKYEICDITGLPKSVNIEYRLNGTSLGKTAVSEKSMAMCRINEAKVIGIDYYDEFILDGGRISSKDVKVLLNGELVPVSDFRDEEISKNQPHRLISTQNVTE